MRGLFLVFIVLTQCAWSWSDGWQKNYPWQNSSDGSGNIVSFPTSANVGIGSTSPGVKLDVNGTVRAFGGFMFSDGTIITTAGGADAWTLNGTNIYPTTITNNVGIGTSNPGATLDVEGALSTVILKGNVGIGTVAVSPYQLIIGNPGGYIYNGSNQSPAQPSIRFNGTTKSLNINGGGSAAVNINDDVGTGGVTFWNGQTGGAAAQVETFLANGNVGILSTNPGSQLDVSGTERVFGNLALANNQSLQFFSQGGSLKNILTYDNNNNVILDSTPGEGSLLLKTLGNQVVTITNTNPANVGIGSTNPAGLLDVQGTINHFQINSSGNAGIGTVNPVSNLQVIGGILTGATTTGALKITGTGSQNYIESGLTTVSSSAAPLNFTSMNAGNIWATISTTGQLGIGSTNPGTTLDVVGTIRGSAGFADGSAIGVTGSGATSCLCKAYTGGICTTIGTCT